MRFRLRTLLIALAIGPVLLIVLATTPGCLRRVDVTAHYLLMYFSGMRGSGTYDTFTTGDFSEVGDGERRAVAPIFFRLDDGTVVYLPDITKKQAEQLVPAIHPESDYWSCGKGKMCLFEDGKLLAISCMSGELSDRRDGPFHKLPIRAKDVQRMFGNPDKITTFTYPFY